MPSWLNYDVTCLLKTFVNQSPTFRTFDFHSDPIQTDIVVTHQIHVMKIIPHILIALVALEHLYFMYIEMCAWETIGKKTFRSLAPELFKPTKALAANQGLYNGFLAAGLIWSLCIGDVLWSFYVAVFFLCCVIVAGLYGAFTVSKKILYIQALPAMIALLAAHVQW